MKKPRWHLLAGLCVVLLCTGWTLWTTTKDSYDAFPTTSLRYEWLEKQANVISDARLLLHSVEDKSFLEMQQYWSRPWKDVTIGGSVFFRPLSIMLVWAMYHTFGENSLAWFYAMVAVSHVIATLVLWRFLCYLFRSETTGTIAVCAFALGLSNHLFKLATPAYALIDWIDIVEPWLMVPYVLTCWTFVKYLREGGRWLLAALALFVVSISVKEAAYTLPIITVALLWYKRRLDAWRTVLPFGAVAVAGLLYRTWALQGMGTKFGSNGSWLQRAIVEMGGGLPAALLNGHDYLSLFAGSALATIVLLFLNLKRGALVVGVLSGVSVAASAISSRGLDDPFYYQLVGSTRVWANGLVVALWLLVVYQIVTKPQREQLFGWAWVAVTYSVLLAAPTNPHTLYIVAVGWGICIAGTAKVLAPHLNSTVRAVDGRGVLPLRSRSSLRHR